MRCPACGSNNPDVARFCSACGARFEAAKPKESEAVLATGSGPRTEAPVKGKGLSVASLVLGILSIFPFSFLTGIPAIITGAIALAQRRLGRGMAIAGVVLGSIGSVVIGAGIILALIIPNFVVYQDRARRTSVKNNMHVFQTDADPPSSGSSILPTIGWTVKSNAELTNSVAEKSSTVPQPDAPTG
jgi:hypothetical protein